VVTGHGRKLRVIVPDEPPRLTPGAAKVLLKILLKADARRTEPGQTKERDQQCNTRTSVPSPSCENRPTSPMRRTADS
jgi:hypothetical protein